MDTGNGFGSRVFWTAAIPDGDVQGDPDAGPTELHVHNLPVFDYTPVNGVGAGNVSLGPDWQTKYVNATVSFDVVWNGPVTRRVNVKDAADNFAGQFKENQATVTWSARSASGFRFTSKPGNFSTSVPEVPGVNGVTAPLNFFAEVGHERNGIFFRSEDGDPGHDTERAGAQTAGVSIVSALTTANAPALGAPVTGHQAGIAPATNPTLLPPQDVAKGQPVHPVSAHHGPAAKAAFTGALDQAFANWDSNTLSAAL